jgi:hypothetical protein
MAWRVTGPALLFLAPAEAFSQGRRQVSYEVEFSVRGSLLDANCSAGGTDVLAGVITGYEPASSIEPNVYVGTLTRFTEITTCGSRRNPAGEDAVCSINIRGNGDVDIQLTIESDQRGGWLQYLTNRTAWEKWLSPQPPARGNSRVTGTCEPAELAHLQNTYDSGETAGSPSGQPIEISQFPPTAYPHTYQPNPPVSIWSLKVLRRRP